MRKSALPLLLVPVAFILGSNSAQQEVEPTCNMCQAELPTADEIQEYIELSAQSPIVADLQIRSIDVGRANVQAAVIHRGSLQEASGRVAEHSLVTEVYYVISGSGSVLTGPELVNPQVRPANSFAVTNLNGPGHNASGVENGVESELNAGVIFVIPAGTGHAWIDIPDHVTYLTFRTDPDKVVKLMNAADARRFLDSGGDFSVLR